MSKTPSLWAWINKNNTNQLENYQINIGSN
jgi:hypothetical protein